jgi:hypothetical protein
MKVTQRKLVRVQNLVMTADNDDVHVPEILKVALVTNAKQPAASIG